MSVCKRSGSLIESRSMWLDSSRCPHCGAVVAVAPVGKLPGNSKHIYRFGSHERTEHAPALRSVFSLWGAHLLPDRRAELAI